MPSAEQVRKQFIEYFVSRCGHTFVPSSPVVPHDDPTLLFTNAGMNQFKPVFLGQNQKGDRFDGLTRAVNSQKCIRAGGKHNDLEDVGRDTYHHTFFEMLGNWSFGDYFKHEAIDWAWDLLVNVWGVDPNRLYATYFEGDKAQGLEPDREAYNLWLKHLPAQRVLPGNAKDNFWEMGDTGPCGPCSEIHYDGRSDAQRKMVPGHTLVNAGDPNVIEIWNLVFIQFNRESSGLHPLPAKHVDTGMGFERIVRVLQHKHSNYDSDVFEPLFARIKEICNAPAYGGTLEGHVDIAYRVIADHARTLTFAITDGAEPSNEGRGYVLRRILRRAVRHGRQTLDVPGAFLCKLVPAIVEQMGGAFPELRKNPERVANVILDEEEAFGRTLDQGIKLFEKAAERGEKFRTVDAEDAFKLHDTYGFPIDLTQVMARERGLDVDVPGFERLMEEAREKSRAGSGFAAHDALALTATAIGKLKALNVKPTRDGEKFGHTRSRARVRAIWNGTDFDENVLASNTRPDDRFAIITDKTCFYAEMGGQVGDAGRLIVVKSSAGPKHGEAVIEDTRVFGGYIVHIARVTKGEIRVMDDVELHVDAPRRQGICANHTATHLLNHALRAVLGDGVNQKGSLVAEDRLRFDYTHGGAMSEPQAGDVERRVVNAIRADLPVYAEEVGLEGARKIEGLRAVFGEAYPDPVRVVSIGRKVDELLGDPSNKHWREFAVEFCGGTHLSSTGEAEAFVLTSEESVSKGVRRVSGLTGHAAHRAVIEGEKLMSRVEGAATLPEQHLAGEVRALTEAIDRAEISMIAKARLRTAVGALAEKAKKASKAAASAGRDQALDAGKRVAEEAMGGAGSVIVAEIPAGSDRNALLAAMDAVKGKHPSAAIMLVSADHDEGKVTIVASVAPEIVKKGLKAGDWVREVSAVVGGKGGGRPDAAQGGGTDPARVGEALEKARSFAGALA
ncbi:MAG: alanine--tRNA ligase [Phycisphaerales bacterium]